MRIAIFIVMGMLIGFVISNFWISYLMLRPFH